MVKFFEVEINGVKYKTQGYDCDDAIESILESDTGGRGSTKVVRDTIDRRTSKIKCRRL